MVGKIALQDEVEIRVTLGADQDLIIQAQMID